MTSNPKTLALMKLDELAERRRRHQDAADKAMEMLRDAMIEADQLGITRTVIIEHAEVAPMTAYKIFPSKKEE